MKCIFSGGCWVFHLVWYGLPRSIKPKFRIMVICALETSLHSQKVCWSCAAAERDVPPEKDRASAKRCASYLWDKPTPAQMPVFHCWLLSKTRCIIFTRHWPSMKVKGRNRNPATQLLSGEGNSPHYLMPSVWSKVSEECLGTILDVLCIYCWYICMEEFTKQSFRLGTIHLTVL